MPEQGREELRAPRGNPPEEPRARSMLSGSVSLGRIFGISIQLHFTVLIIFGLIVFSLASGTFPAWHPDWSPALHWGLAFATAVLFFISLLAHEMAHSLVARRRGMEIHRITLFLFGGISELKSEPPSASTEFLVAIAGPLMSVFIGFASLLLAGLFVGDDFMARVAEDPAAAYASLGPLPTLLLWLGPINLFLALFNMIPGFPLDGGRVLRSILWATSKDLRKATRWAANAGKAVAFLMMGLGVLTIVYGGLVDGLWLLLIAWFLYGAARSAYAETVVRQSLTGFTVADLMDTSFDTVDAEMDIATLVAQKLSHSAQAVWPVVRNGQVVGTLSLARVSEVPAEARTNTPVSRIMHPLLQGELVEPDTPGPAAMQKLAEVQEGVLVVARAGRVLGLLSREDVMRWLALFARQPRMA